MRFQPIIVPRPSAKATEILTQIGNEFRRAVEVLLIGGERRVVRLARSLRLVLLQHAIASDARYMSLRVLPAAAAGIFAIEP